VTTVYVAYIATNTKNKISNASNRSSDSFSKQESDIQKFFLNHDPSTLLKTFIELGDNKRSRHPLPELENAIQYALEHKAYLLLGNVNNFIHNPAFAKLIDTYLYSHQNDVDFIPEIYCCDQPYIKKENFKAISNHMMQQRKRHGDLIKAGLDRSNCKSGNPNAINIINKVNRPKIDNAIVFALMLAPIVHHYQLKGLSQRKLVMQLNEDGFTAPEGGHWVLSQLQKVLKRIKLNESALSLEKKISLLEERGFNDEQIAEHFNSLDIPTPIDSSWSPDMVVKLKKRIKQIQDIIEFHEFVLNLSPILEKYHIDELNEDVFANELQLAKIDIPAAFYTGGATH